MSEVRAYTEEECRDKFLRQVAAVTRYWLGDNTAPEIRDKMNGIVFSILVILDGGSVLPAFTVTPRPCPEDKAYDKDNGENWWPYDVDIAGSLHELWNNYEVK